MTIAPDRPVTRVIPKPAAGWESGAACRPQMTRAQLHSACLTCPVRVDCFRDGYHTGDRDTFRAGMAGDDRDQWLTDRGIPLPAAAETADRVQAERHGNRYLIDLNDVARLRSAGQSWREIGHRYGCSAEAVSSKWRRSGRPSTGKAHVTRRDLSADIDPRVLKTYLDAGASTRRISLALGVDRTTVQRHIARAREAGLL